MKAERLWNEIAAGGPGPAAASSRLAPGRRHALCFMATVDAGASDELTQVLPSPGLVTSLECHFPSVTAFQLRMDPHIRHAGGAVEDLVQTVVPAGADVRLSAEGGLVRILLSTAFDTLDQLHLEYENTGAVPLTFLVKVEVLFNA